MKLSEQLSVLYQTKELWGIVVYECVGDGCLNGTGTNNDNAGHFINEIARKKYGNTSIEVEGEYTVAYIEPKQNKTFAGILKISRSPNEIYKVIWEPFETLRGEFEGVGLKTGEKQFTVFYWQTKKH